MNRGMIKFAIGLCALLCLTVAAARADGGGFDKSGYYTQLLEQFDCDSGKPDSGGSSVHPIYTASPANNDGTEKAGMSLCANLSANVDATAINNWRFSTGHGGEGQSYILNYQFYISGEDCYSTLVSLRQGTTNVPLLGIDYDGHFTANGAATESVYQKDRWYSVELVLTFANRKFDAYVDGTLIAAGAGISRGSFDRLVFYSSNHDKQERTASIYVDDIVLSQLHALPDAPQATAAYYANGEAVSADSVPADGSEIRLTFSGEIDPDTLEDGVRITDADGVPCAFTASYCAEERMYTLHFPEGLVMGTTYTLTADTVADVFGQTLSPSLQEYFTVELRGFAVSDVTVTGQSGSAPESAAEALDFRVLVQNMTEEGRTVALIAVRFGKNGKIRAYTIEEQTAAAFTFLELEASLDAAAQEGGSVAVFVWDGYNSMHPLKEEIILN